MFRVNTHRQHFDYFLPNNRLKNDLFVGTGALKVVVPLSFGITCVPVRRKAVIHPLETSQFSSFGSAAKAFATT